MAAIVKEETREMARSSSHARMSASIVDKKYSPQIRHWITTYALLFLLLLLFSH